MKKGFLKEILAIFFAYTLIHCFVALISNNPSPDYDMWLELNIMNIISVYTYFIVTITLNLIAFLYGMWLSKKKKVLNFIGVNIINFIFYYVSYMLLNLQLERIIDTEQIIIITRGLGYIAILSLGTIIFLLCVTNARNILKKGKIIILKNKKELKEEVNKTKKE